MASTVSTYLLVIFMKRQNYLLLVFGDTYYLDIIRNLYENNIKKYGIKNFIVATMSKTAFEEYKEYNVPVELIKYNSSGYIEFTNIRTQYFVKKMHMRVYVLYKYIHKSKLLVHIDADTYFLTHPLNIYKMKRNEDIAYACNDMQCSIYNTGYMYIYI